MYVCMYCQLNLPQQRPEKILIGILKANISVFFPVGVKKQEAETKL